MSYKTNKKGIKMLGLGNFLKFLKDMIGKIKNRIYNFSLNRMSCLDYAKKVGVDIGNNCRIMTKKFSSEPYIISIGDNTTVSLDVEFVTHDGAVHVLRNLYNEYKNIDIIKPINIGNNCFIGTRSIILPGVNIGNNTIVAAGSIVTKSFQSNLIIGGVPAKKIATLEEYISKNKADFIFTKYMSQKDKKKYIQKLLKNEK